MPAAPTLKHRLLRTIGHQRWITRGRTRFVRALCNPDTAPDIPFEVDYFGKRYAGSLANFMDWTIYFFGRYESEELALFRDLARALRSQRPQVTFYDVGSNVGTHSLFMSGQVTQVHAFEPNPAMVDKLNAKIRLNALRNIALHPIGLADSDETRGFYLPDHNNTGVGSFVYDAGQLREPISLPVRKGDGYLNEQQLPRMDILKMDIQGYEVPALQGLHARLQADRPIIILEMCHLTRQRWSEKEFVAALYPEHRIYNLLQCHDWMRYQIIGFDYQRDGNLVVVPAEFAHPLLPELSR